VSEEWLIIALAVRCVFERSLPAYLYAMKLVPHPSACAAVHVVVLRRLSGERRTLSPTVELEVVAGHGDALRLPLAAVQ